MAETYASTAADQSDASDIVAKLRRRIIEQSLPLWSTEGWDRATGGFVDRLTLDGHADIDAPRRVFVQARQIYCFAKVAQIGWYPEGRRIAVKGGSNIFWPRPRARTGAPATCTGWRMTVLSWIRCAIPTTTPSCCSLSPPFIRWIAMRRFAPKWTLCLPLSMANCIHRTVASWRDGRRRCRAGRIRKCTCLKR